MKYSLVFLSLFLVLGVGCTPTSSTLTSDFIPVRGSSSAPSTDVTDSPHDRRIMTAISYDGLSYIQNDAWVCDQCHAPDAVIKDGTIYLYYTGGIVGDKAYTTAVAISSDQGKTWTYKYVDIVGDEGGGGRFFDPDVVLLEDGSFRMYFVSGLPRSLFYAESPDGITYTYKAQIFAPKEDKVTHPTVFKIDHLWHLYALSEDNEHRVWFLTSTDGVRFEMYAMTSFPIEGVPATPSNSVWVEDRFHLFLFDNKETIKSQWSKNGLDWYPDTGTRLSPVDEETTVSDPTVVKLDDGRYLMFYVTNIPSSSS